MKFVTKFTSNFLSVLGNRSRDKMGQSLSNVMLGSDLRVRLEVCSCIFNREGCDGILSTSKLRKLFDGCE